MKEHFENATEKFEFTTLNGWGNKKVLKFIPKEDPQDKFDCACVRELSVFGDQMNVKSITNSGMMLYTFDMLGQKQTGKIKFEDIELGNTLDNE